MTKSILAATVAAVHEQIRAESTLSRPATPISEAEVVALVETLPERAREGKEGHAAASVFLFTEWDPRNRRAAEVAGAALERLRALGLTPEVENVKLGARVVPGRILVDYADLGAVAQREEEVRVRWVEAALIEWRKVGGEGADVRLVTAKNGSVAAKFTTRALAVPVNDATPFRLDFLVRAREREHAVEDFWALPVEETVAGVEAVIRPVRWTIPDLEAAWSPHGNVTFSYGLYEVGQLRQCAVVEFRRGDRALKLAVEDVRRLSAADLAARALEGPWETVASAGPPVLMDRAPASMVAGSARDRAMGITRPGEHHDAFRYVAPPGPPRAYSGDVAPPPEPAAVPHPVSVVIDHPFVYESAPDIIRPQALTVPIGNGDSIDPTRMTPVEAMAALPEMRASSRPQPAKEKDGGRSRKASPAKAASS